MHVEGGWADIVAKEADIKATQLRRIFHYVKDLKLKYRRDPEQVRSREHRHADADVCICQKDEGT